MLLLKPFARVVNYVLTLGIIGFGWYQDPSLVPERELLATNQPAEL